MSNNLTLRFTRQMVSGMLPILVAVFLLYIPTFKDLAATLWKSDEHIHGPIVVFVSLFLIWSSRDELINCKKLPRPALGWSIFLLGLCLYAIGRSQEIVIFELGSMVIVFIGICIVEYGLQVVRILWFVWFFLLFALPLPGAVVDAITSPLKAKISYLAEELLFWLDYPVARTGVILQIGQYRLFVADACSGLNSMFSLSAMGSLYIYLTNNGNKIRNAILISAMLPIAFFANVVRVIVLILVTYYFGSDIAQGFVHGMAGILLFIVSLVLLFVMDSFVNYVCRPNDKGNK